MPKLTGPCHSDTARGTLGKAITFQMVNGQARCKGYARPKQPNSLPQQLIRATTRRLMQIWTELTDEQRALWAALPRATKLAPNNLFYVENWNRVKRGLNATATPPPSITEIPPTITRLEIGGNPTNYTLIWQMILPGSADHATSTVVGSSGPTTRTLLMPSPHNTPATVTMINAHPPTASITIRVYDAADNLLCERSITPTL